MKTFFALFMYVVTAIGLFLALVSFIALLTVLPAVIPWLLYNFILAPAFGWPHASFWIVWAVVWILGVVGRLLKNS